MHGFDTIVVGGGIIGSGIAYYASRSGRRVLILDQHEATPNPIGSSSDHACVFRLAHGHDSFGASLAVQALDLWRHIQGEIGETLIEQTGVLDLGTGLGRHEEAGFKTLGDLRIPVQRMSSAEACERFRMLRRGSFRFAVFHPDGGFVWAQRAIQAFTRSAMKRGSRTVRRVRVVKVLKGKGGVQGVKDSSGKVWTAQDYVFALGPWTSAVLSGFGVNLQVARQHSLYFRPPRNMGRFNPSHFPVFSASGRGFSGFPVHIHGFMRIGRDKGVSPCPGVDAAAAPDPVFQKKCRAFLDEFIPDLADFSEWEDRIGYTARTPDGDFILDRLPGTENGFLAVGFSGKAPMFAPLVGKVMDSMLHRLKPEINMHRFRLGRLEPAP